MLPFADPSETKESPDIGSGLVALRFDLENRRTPLAGDGQVRCCLQELVWLGTAWQRPIKRAPRWM
jgi:hypothetical protein